MNDLKIKKIDLYAKVTLGIIGFIISVTLGYSQYCIQKDQNVNNLALNKQNENLQHEQNKFQILKIVNDNLPYYSEKSEKGEISRVIITNSALILSKEYQFPDLAQLLTREFNNKQLSDQQHLNLSQATGDKEWFCIIGSYKTLKEAQVLWNKANVFLASNKIDVNAGVYQNPVGVYAVTVGDILPLLKANAYVQLSKTSQLAKDAYYEINANWKKVK